MNGLHTTSWRPYKQRLKSLKKEGRSPSSRLHSDSRLQTLEIPACWPTLQISGTEFQWLPVPCNHMCKFLKRNLSPLLSPSVCIVHYTHTHRLSELEYRHIHILLALFLWRILANIATLTLNNEVGLFMPAAAAAKSLQSCPTLCDPIDGSPPGSTVPGILQARTLEWAAISFSNAWKWKWSRSVVSDS